jgi:hypothetical protein
MQPQEIGQKLNLEKLSVVPDLLQMMTYDRRNSCMLDAEGQVTGLNLRGNGLTDEHIDFLWKIPGLQALNLSENKFSRLSIPAGLSSLRYLNLCENPGLQVLHFEAALPALEEIDLSESNLRELHFPAGFDALRLVYLQKNKLRKFSIAGACPALRLLDLAANQLTEFSLPGDLPRLELLYLQGGNRVEDISRLTAAPALQTLNLAGNAVTDLSPLRRLVEKGVPVQWEEKGGGILLQDCPLNNPGPEVVKQGAEAILNYFREQDEQGTDTLYEAKLLIVGEPSAGKTSLCRRMLHPGEPLPAEGESTKGIDIHRYDFPLENGRDFRVNVWDFGGQEIYHATHQFFLTKRSLYILLDDTRSSDKTVQDKSFKFWLEVIDLLSDHSPVLIFQNEKSGRSKSIDMPGIKGRFDNVMERYAGNLERPGAANAIKAAAEFFIRRLPHVGQQLPKKWIDIRREIEERATEEPFLSRRDYYRIYDRYLPFDREKALHLSRYLHDLGVFLHFQEDDLLGNTVILQNAWATEAVYRMLDDEEVKAKLGRFTTEDCQRVWSNSDYADMHPQLRQLMSKFELCYPLRDVRPPTWLAPQLLPPSKPAKLHGWERAGDLSLNYQYDFLPKGLINRLMVRQHRFVKRPELAWRNGVLFERGQTQLLVQLSVKGDEILLRARGPERKEILSILSAELDALNESFPGLAKTVTKLVPCICGECRANITPSFYTYEELRRRREKNKKTIECRHSFEDVSVQALLDGIQADPRRVEAFREAAAGQAKKIFFSYSKHDRAHLEQLKKHLSILTRNGHIQPWDDHDIQPGGEWDAAVREQLAEADIILLLISADFLATEYIWEVEIKEAMARYELGEVRVIPVVVGKCDWEKTPLGTLNSLPTKGKAVTSYADQDEAWTKVVEGIRRVIEVE